MFHTIFLTPDRRAATNWLQIDIFLIFDSLSVFKIRAGPTRSEDSSGPGRLGRKFLQAGPTSVENSSGPTWAENSPGPGRLGPKILPGRAGRGRFPKN